jgi:ParB/RepB/Spo0J family partition protein
LEVYLVAEKTAAINKFRPNPYQPETRFNVSEEDARKFGLSILEHGMILTPVARRADGPGFYEIGDGWLRLKGHDWLVNNGHLEYQEMRFDERDLTDRQMADLILEANKVRKDLNPMEEAQFYKRYLEDFKVTQTELAEKHNITQGEMANTLRLLELPENVQQRVISQEITGTHGRQLLRLNTVPELQEKFVEAAIKNNLSVSQLDLEINRTLYQNSKLLAPNQWNSPVFDTAGCDTCPYRMMLADPWGHNKKESRCINSECWEKKQAEAEKKREAEAKKRLAKKTAGQKILTEKDIRHGDFQSMNDYSGSYKQVLDNPAECDNCPKKGLYKYHYKDKEEEICMDPKCYRAKKSKRTREENKKKKEKDKELTARLGEIFEKTSKNRYGALVIATRNAVRKMQASARDDLASMFVDLPRYSNGRLDQQALAGTLYGKSEPELVKLLAAALISQERRNNCYQDYSFKLGDDELTAISIMENTYEARVEEMSAFQEANCRGCNSAIEALINSGEICCKETYRRRIKDGICENSPNKDRLTGKKKKEEKVPAEAEERIKVAETE